jgi:hypothetical protein
MRVIISNSFKKNYLHDIQKQCNQHDFITFLKQKQHTFIWLHHPYFKIKGNIKGISIRWVLFLFESDTIIPLMVFLKKNKKYWENINWYLFENEILSEYKKVIEDIKDWKIDIF